MVFMPVLLKFVSLADLVFVKVWRLSQNALLARRVPAKGARGAASAG
jgi:hypothetical protein